MIVVTGTGRCGTTFLINLFRKLGVDIGSTRSDGEHDAAVNINFDILKARGSVAWKDTDELAERFKTRMQAISNPIIKNPDFHSTLDVWAKNRDDLRIAVCHRRLDDTAKSYEAFINRLPAHEYPPWLPEGPLKNHPAYYLGLMMDQIWKLELPHQILHFPQTVEENDYIWRKLSAWMTMEGIGKCREDFILMHGSVADKKLIHHREGQSSPGRKWSWHG